MEIPYYTSKMIKVYDRDNPPAPPADPDRQYEFVIFRRDTKADEYNAYANAYFQTRYPPFVCDSSEGDTTVNMYLNGADCDYRMVLNFYSDCYDRRIAEGKYYWEESIYLRNLSVLMSGFTHKTHTGWRIMSEIEDYQETGITIFGAHPEDEHPGLVIESLGAYHAISLFWPRVNILLPTSTWHTPDGNMEGEMALKYGRISTKTHIEEEGMWLTQPFGDCDYRIIKGMPFQSGEEWLAWCKEH